MAQYFFPDKLSVSPSPHMRTLETVRGTMLDVIIALLPATLWGVYIFGVRALLIIALSVMSSVISEIVFQLLMKKPLTAGNLSSAVTGLILGLTMPPAVSLWIPVVGGAFATVVVKELFGGIGKNIVNPALTSRIFLMLCFPAQMTKYVDLKTDVITSATPLVSLKAGELPQVTLFNSVNGNITGAIGEISVIALCAGFIYLLFRRVVRWEIPVAFLGVAAVWALVLPAGGDSVKSLAFELTSGGMLFAALFAANDMTTTPITSLGRILFGAGCGIITMVIRYFGAYPDGTAFAVVIMNLTVPLLEMCGAGTPFGKKKAKEGEEK